MCESRWRYTSPPPRWCSPSPPHLPGGVTQAPHPSPTYPCLALSTNPLATFFEVTVFVLSFYLVKFNDDADGEAGAADEESSSGKMG